MHFEVCERFIGKGLVYGRTVSENPDVFVGYVDSDYVGSTDTRKFQTGFVFSAFDTAVRWKDILRRVVALSTTEAEY